MAIGLNDVKTKQVLDRKKIEEVESRDSTVRPWEKLSPVSSSIKTSNAKFAVRNAKDIVQNNRITCYKIKTSQLDILNESNTILNTSFDIKKREDNIEKEESYFIKLKNSDGYFVDNENIKKEKVVLSIIKDVFGL